MLFINTFSLLSSSPHLFRDATDLQFFVYPLDGSSLLSMTILNHNPAATGIVKCVTPNPNPNPNSF